MEIKQIGNISNKAENNPQSNRVYDKSGLCPTLSSMRGGGLQPMIIEIGKLNKSQDGLVVDSNGIAKTITAGHNNQPKIICKVNCLNTKKDDGEQTQQQDRVYGTNGLMTAITAELGGRFNILENKTIVAMRGKTLEGTSNETRKNTFEQHLEPNNKRICNTLTTIQKDNLVLEKSIYNYRIRKLTPLECWRLMGFSDEDFHKAEGVVSQTHLYSQAGKSIVKSVLLNLFKQLNIKQGDF